MSGLRFVRHAARAGLPIVIVNRGITRGDPLATCRVDAGCSQTLRALVDALSRPIPGTTTGATARPDGRPADSARFRDRIRTPGPVRPGLSTVSSAGPGPHAGDRRRSEPRRRTSTAQVSAMHRLDARTRAIQSGADSLVRHVAG